MESYLHHGHFDLITPDGRIIHLKKINEKIMEVDVFIENISPAFVGFQIEPECVFFNLKSALAQLGLTSKTIEFSLDFKGCCAEVKLNLIAIGNIAKQVLQHLLLGSYVGKLFAADDRRRVRTSDYLYRMFNRYDRFGSPLLSLGKTQGSHNLILENINNHAVAFLGLKEGCIEYNNAITSIIPSLTKALTENFSIRHFLKLHQEWYPEIPRVVKKNKILLVSTLPLHMRTVFGRVVNSLLPNGYNHTTADILQPDTKASGDIYELFGDAESEITDIPLEFYTLEPHREYVFFADRDQLQSCLEDPESLKKAFQTAPQPLSLKAAVFVVKGSQLLNLKAHDWITRKPKKHEFPGIVHESRQAAMVERYIEKQPSYLFLKSIEDGLITSQGILLTRYFPSPVMKRLLLSSNTHKQLKAIYFQYPSLSNDLFFSHEDIALLNDLNKFGIPVFWVDNATNKILQYIQKQDQDSGLFVPINQVQDFLQATMFGVYGSNLFEGEFENELKNLLKGIQELKNTISHPLINPSKPLALLTGGGPGVMEVGNRVARQLNILSCANIVDFRFKKGVYVHEQLQNSHIDAKMTYRLNKLVERQAAFQLDFPIFLPGGIGTDFELTLEEVRRKVGAIKPTPVLLFGTPEYWKTKITTRFQSNKNHGMIKGSEWISNCFYCVNNAKQGLSVYEKFFTNKLEIGPTKRMYDDGFCTCT